MSKSTIQKKNLNFVIILGLALGTRRLAMNLVTPFVASYAQSLLYGSLVLGGIALGIYSLTQGFFQVPFGNLYDKIGGKKVVLIGLAILILGLILAVVSDNAYIYVISRALQGSGAITAAGYSWLSASVSKEERVDAISLVGTIVGLAAAVSLGGGPILIKFISVKILYLFSTIVVVIVFFAVMFLKEERFETKNKKVANKKETSEYLKKMFRNKRFVSCLIVVFSSNYIGIASFFIIPEYLKITIGMDNMWEVLTPSIIIAIIVMRISTKFVKKGKVAAVVLISGLAMTIGCALLLTRSENIIILLIESILIFSGYTIVSTLIPTIINSIVKDEVRGTLNGITNGFVYIGSFFGATLSGILWAKHLEMAITIIFILSILVIVLSFVMKKKKVRKVEEMK